MENVHFPGFLDDEKYINLLINATAYVQVSYHEGFGLACAEAMAIGTPIIHSGEGALKEVVASAGLLVKKGDYHALGEAIKLLLTDHRKWSKLSKKAKDQAKLFRISKREKALKKIVESMLQ